MPHTVTTRKLTMLTYHVDGPSFGCLRVAWRPSWMGTLHESGHGIWKIGYTRNSWRTFVKEDVWWSEADEKWGNTEHDSTKTRKFAGKFDGELWDLLGWYPKHEIQTSGRTLTRILALAFWSIELKTPLSHACLPMLSPSKVTFQ